MSGLTVTEKNHWRDRIAARIDRRIETILAADPGLMVRVQGEARGGLLSRLGSPNTKRSWIRSLSRRRHWTGGSGESGAASSP